MAEHTRRTAAEAVEGSHRGDFRPIDWSHALLNSLIFGSAFLWIALALESISPGLIAFGRVSLGAAVLLLVRKARRAIARDDWPRLAVAGLFGQAAPALLFALAEQHIASSVTGMLMSAVPIATAIITATVTRALPGRRRVLGLAIGTAGIVLLSLPNLGGGDAGTLGIVFVVIAVFSYATASNLYAPLQQTYGALPVVMWSLLFAAVILAPFGAVGWTSSTFEPVPVLSLIILGVLGTGIARSLYVALIGRVGAVRATVVGYTLPIVALVLGVAVLDEHIEAIQLVGMVVALAGGYVLSRPRRKP